MTGESEPGVDADGDSGSPPDDPGPSADGADATPDEIRAALAEVRREVRKAAFVYASLDAVCVLLAVDLAAGVAGVPALDAAVARASFGSLGLPAPDLGTLVGLVAGAVAFAAEFAVRARRPAAERFEDANPAVSEALRTARDAAGAYRENPMTRALYADVLDRLRESSSVGLLDATRLAATVGLALALSLASVQTAVVGLDLGAGVAGSGTGSTGPAHGSDDRAPLSNRSAELRSGDEVLGEPTDVTAGSENLSAAVSASPGGEGERDWNYETEAGDSAGPDGGVDARRAGFASPERVEDAALVRRYAHELGGNTTDD
ncbi:MULTISPECIES: hypothetical protein [Halorussus]|uniref:DUF7502 family protein n=1 Tax=Halorussus TaxID=1070314 RepID=UPI000E217EF5|nr:MULTISPECIES: hypothetical protein [Halorussus]NHN59307.1 hypothetical protein [Halorussus sp. JP-T4]